MTLPVPNDQQPELWEELKVDGQWFHVVRSMIMRDRIAEMGVNAWAVYCVLKAYTQLDSGKTFPSQDLIARHLGVSVDTVARATDKLLELQIVTKKKVGRRNEYRLVESVPLRNNDEAIVAFGEREYTPVGFQKFIGELKDFARSGAMNPDSQVRIVFNVNFIQQGDNGTVHVTQVDDGRGEPFQKPAVPAPEHFREFVRRLKTI